MATALTPQTDVTSGGSLQKIKSIKNPIKLFIFYFIKSETIDSFVNHFNRHFAYLKTLDFKLFGLLSSKDVALKIDIIGPENIPFGGSSVHHSARKFYRRGQ